jgi:uncharacterized membrane protein YoaK (UPF0700 family)
MTGNVVFLGFAIAGARGLSAGASLIALGAFLCGAFTGGLLSARNSDHRGHMLRAATSVQVGLLAIAIVVAASGHVAHAGVRDGLLVSMGLAMGVQNSVALRLAVPELTTTVLTRTLTGIASETTIAGGEGSRLGRRAIAVAAMLLGAIAGALLALNVSIVAALAVATAIVFVVSVVIRSLSRAEAAWTRA